MTLIRDEPAESAFAFEGHCLTLGWSGGSAFVVLVGLGCEAFWSRSHRSRYRFVRSDPKVEALPMSILVRFTPTALTAEKYDKTIRMLEDAKAEFPPPGLAYHVCFGSEGNLLVSEIWDTREQFEAFGEHLMPILAEAGIEFSDAPNIIEVHNIIER